jgi:hypothetical protein
LINYKIFIVDDNIYTREEIYENYAFIEFNTQPELYFDQKIVGEFFVPIVGVNSTEPATKFERTLIAKTAHDQTWKFYTPRDILKMHKAKKPITEAECIRPTRVANSKIYVAGKRFERFLHTQDSVSTFISIGTNQKERTTNIFGLMQSLTLAPPSAPLAIGDIETVKKDEAGNKMHDLLADLE